MKIEASTSPNSDGQTLIIPFAKTMRAQITKEKKKEEKVEPYQFDKATETLEIAEGAMNGRFY